ncbi:flagellar biosynthetic protein FliO [Moritella yayanosii]|uniref:Flagellar protein n=1 Tax=Moritella yayanosii TaxID=69539 RepID=A0A330LY14_9GAMM|nr:flagellar biosynthetic protein FliO [Moritella yayanosii]SQD80598.1 putative flagellar biosynthesis protein FliO [Moritella yayanosii]
MNDIDMLQWLLSLLVVISVILILAFVAKKARVFGSNNQLLHVVATLPLGPKERIMVVQVGSEQVLLGVTGQQINLLKELAQPLDNSQPELNPFATKLALMMKQHNEK